jgi:hypothetical protein
LESDDRLALEPRVRQQHGLVRLGFDGIGLIRIGIFRVGIDVRVGVGRRLLCHRVECDRGLYGRHDGQ